MLIDGINPGFKAFVSFVGHCRNMEEQLCYTHGGGTVSVLIYCNSLNLKVNDRPVSTTLKVLHTLKNTFMHMFMSLHSISDNKHSHRIVSVETHWVEEAVLCGLKLGQWQNVDYKSKSIFL